MHSLDLVQGSICRFDQGWSTVYVTGIFHGLSFLFALILFLVVSSIAIVAAVVASAIFLE